MGGSGLIGFLQILKGLEAKGHPGLREQFWELARAASRYEGHARYRHADGRYFCLAFEDYRLPFGKSITKRGHGPFVSRPNGAEG